MHYFATTRKIMHFLPQYQSKARYGACFILLHKINYVTLVPYEIGNLNFRYFVRDTFTFTSIYISEKTPSNLMNETLKMRWHEPLRELRPLFGNIFKLHTEFFVKKKIRSFRADFLTTS